MNLYHYSLLRLQKDERDNWIKKLGIKSLCVNNLEIKEKFPRLYFHRKRGSHTTHEYLPPRIFAEVESRFKEAFEELNEREY